MGIAMTLSNLPTYDHLLYFFAHPLTLIVIVLLVTIVLIKKQLKRTNAKQGKSIFVAVLFTSLISGLQTTTANADKTTPLLESNNLKRKALNLPTPSPSSASSLTPANAIRKNSRPTKKITHDTKLKAAVDPAQATTTSPATTKPKNGPINIKVKVGNITNTNGSIKIGTIESKKK